MVQKAARSEASSQNSLDPRGLPKGAWGGTVSRTTLSWPMSPNSPTWEMVACRAEAAWSTAL